MKIFLQFRAGIPGGLFPDVWQTTFCDSGVHCPSKRLAPLALCISSPYKFCWAGFIPFGLQQFLQLFLNFHMYVPVFHWLLPQRCGWDSSEVKPAIFPGQAGLLLSCCQTSTTQMWVAHNTPRGHFNFLTFFPGTFAELLGVMSVLCWHILNASVIIPVVLLRTNFSNLLLFFTAFSMFS